MKVIKILIVIMLMAMPVFSQTGMPSITVTESEKEFTLPIKRAKIDVKIVGSLAITTYDIHFFNPNKRTLEGQLDFPLADGVVVSRFAIDVNKKLREGVIVEKDKGRQTFEKIVKRRVDLGLLEVTRGSNFRARVYPLWPEHEKHIVIAYEEELKVTPDGLKYSLPLDMPNQLNEFSFKATIYSDFAKPINNSTNGSKFRHKDDSYTLLSEYTNYKAKELYEFIIPYFGEESIQLETYNNEDFFRISLNPDMMLQAKEKPQTISILWDISASRLNSDIVKDLELLEEYLEYNKCNVELVPFSLYADDPSYFPNVDFHELKTNIDGLRIDGATNYSSVDISKLRGDEIFIFSDGIDNIGAGGFGETEKPMYIINSSSISDHDACRKQAQKTGGKYINLIDENTSSALHLLTYNFPYFMGIDGAASEVYPNNAVVKGNINISGKLLSSSQLKLKFGYGNKVAKTIPINITEANRTNSGILHKIWAKQKLADLNLNQTQNETEITELGKKYSLVTAFTSLIVLETAWDYYGYKIDPPEELREEYDSVKAEIARVEKENADILDEQIPSADERLKEKLKQTLYDFKAWYKSDFKEKKYLDSCYNLIDQKVGDLVESFKKRHDNEAYYVVNLKELFPNCDFSKRKSINYHLLRDCESDWEKEKLRINSFHYVSVNEEILPRYRYAYDYHLEKHLDLDPENFYSELSNKDKIHSLNFVFDIRQKLKYGLSEKYKNRQDIGFDSNQLVKIKISSEDFDRYYNKLYIIKDLTYYLSKKNIEDYRQWKEYAKKLDQVVYTELRKLDEIPNEELYTIINLDSLLPDYKYFNRQHFKYIDYSFEMNFYNQQNDSLYQKFGSRAYSYFYDLTDYTKDNNYPLWFRTDGYTHSSTDCAWDETIETFVIRIQKSRISQNGLYLITNLDYKQYANQFRPKYRNQIVEAHNKIAIRIAKDSSELDLSKVYVFKNIAIGLDNKNYLKNLKESFKRRWKQEAELGIKYFVEDNYESPTKSDEVAVFPLGQLDRALPNLVDKKIRIFWETQDKLANTKLTFESATLYSGTESLVLNRSQDHFYGSYGMIYLDSLNSENKYINDLDSIVFTLSIPEEKFPFELKRYSYDNKTDLNLIEDAGKFTYTFPISKKQSAYENIYIVQNPVLSEKYLEEKQELRYTINRFSKADVVRTSLKGIVTDEGLKPLPGATVRILGTKKGAKTKPDGRFRVFDIEPGKYDVECTYFGKSTIKIEDVDVSLGKINNLVFIMKDKCSVMRCVIVPPNPYYQENMLDYDETYPQSADEDLVDVISMKPGVGSDKEAINQISSVTTVAYQSSKEYYEELSSVALGELKDTYFELRKSNQLNPSFFFDAAKVFEKQGKIKEACRVMSNLAEINLEDHENLRRVGGFLMEHKEYSLAKSIYKHILKIRSEEPQSFRDYALCLAESGEFQAAADSLYNLFNSPITWDCKGIRTALITEFNTLLVEHKDEIDISNYVSDYIFETPVDLKIELSWVMDGIDIDLWVQEPDRTNCHKGYRFTKNGGYFSANWYRDNNPSVYMIKNAIPGTYKIKAQYKSNRRQKSSLEPQIRCKIYTNYGRPNQKLQENVIKIEIDKGEVDLGEIVID